MLDRYLEAVAARDPGRLPLAQDVRFTEDGQVLPLGEGFWATASAVGGYRNVFVDVEKASVAGFATLRENGAPVTLVARLKAPGGRIAEIETFVARASGGLGAMAGGPAQLEALPRPDPLWEVPAPGPTPSRQELIDAADNYFWGLEKNAPGRDYSFFAEDCERLENGLKTTNNTGLRYGEGLRERGGDASEVLASFAAMSARAQFETGYFAFVDRIRDRRFPVVDVERGVVFSLAFFDHSGTVHQVTLNDGRTIEAGPREPFTWEVGEAFKIEHGKLRRIEAVMRRCPYGMPPNWPAAPDELAREKKG